MSESMYYDISQVNSYNALFNFLHGARGIGKSFSLKKMFVEQFLTDGSQFYYLRRYREDLTKSSKGFFDSLQEQGLFEDIVFTKDGGKNGGTFYANKEPIGYYGALTKGKGVELPKVKYINYDEYLIDKSDQYHGYLRDEVTQFLEFYESIARMRNVTVYFTSNNTDGYSPYFDYFKLKKPMKKNGIWRQNDLLYQEIKTSVEYIQTKYDTRFGKIIKGTRYGKYAVENENLHITNDFLKKKPATAKCTFNLQIGKNICGVYFDYCKGEVFFSCNGNKNMITYTVVKADHTANNILVRGGKCYHLAELKKAFAFNQLFFDSPKAKNLFERIEHLL